MRSLYLPTCVRGEVCDVVLCAHEHWKQVVGCKLQRRLLGVAQRGGCEVDRVPQPCNLRGGHLLEQALCAMARLGKKVFGSLLKLRLWEIPKHFRLEEVLESCRVHEQSTMQAVVHVPRQAAVKEVAMLEQQPL